MDFSVRFQDPFDPEPAYLLEAMSEAAHGAQRVLGTFSFATRTGVDLLFGDPSFARVVETGEVRLVVGIDAVTDAAALLRLKEWEDDSPSLRCEVFWNETDALFHPKLCYFQTRCRSTAIVGSGNLTKGGLRDNYEAYSIASGNRRAMDDAVAEWLYFLDENESALCPIDEEVLERVARNDGREPRPRRRSRRVTHGESQGHRVLVAELPRGGNRWQQANFDTATMEHFFRADGASESRRLVFLNQVEGGGELRPDEVRPCTLTQSRNLRIQLGAHAGVAYPRAGRPVAVFVELKTRHFIYMLLLPNERGYERVRRLLESEDANRIRRRIIALRELADAWPNCPLIPAILREGED